jgi:hypothetical protein
MEQQQVNADELIASLREFVGVLVQENLTYKILLGKLNSGDSPQQ